MKIRNSTFYIHNSQFFSDDGGDYDSDSSGMLDVVRYRVRADALWPSNRVRHVFGPQETFKVIIENGQTFGFTAPLLPGDSSVSFDYHGSSCPVPIRVIAPNGVEGFWMSDDLECSGSTIGAGFYAGVQVQPSYVSFEKIEIMEDVAPVASRWGCFLNLLKYPHEQFAHTEERGALRPQEIGDGNMIKAHDHVRSRLGDYPVENGGCSLNIPVKWGLHGGPYTQLVGNVPMTVNVQTNGKVSVSKFGITRGREPYGIYEGD